MLDKAILFLGALILMSKVAFKARTNKDILCIFYAKKELKCYLPGSSQHGNALRASVASNWVVAAKRSSPSNVYLDR